ncbi:MAG: EAL domain-containing protein [Pseudomonadota bacterium]
MEPTRLIRPDYSIQGGALPIVDIADIASGNARALAAVQGKQVVISGLGDDDRPLSVPNVRAQSLPSAAVHVIAAETYMRGAGMLFGATEAIAILGALLLLIATASVPTRTRRIAYALWVASFAMAFVLTASQGHRVMLADAMILGLVYASLRATSNYRRRHLFIDSQSRLPNFTAFRRDLEVAKDPEGCVVMVAKIARLDSIFATLKPGQQGEYLRQVATRLRLGEGNTQVFHDGGKYLAMVLRASDYGDLEGHLEGLRAVASQAVAIGGLPIDVAITIGVDQSFGAPVANRISSAIAAADQAREAYRPVFIISDFEADSEEWDHSLQSRLESALSENRISVKLQPKVDMRSGLFVGSEALARWTDRRHGEIPPNRFILQCERAGRLDELTKRVMKKSMDASRHLASNGLPAKVSVNVSAIQFVDSRIVDLVYMALEETRADPANMMIEITETARIEDIRQAGTIIEEIKALGLGFSIDDFGVGSGNLAALYELPFDELKIDRMFANEVQRSQRARAVVDALLKLSRDLGIRSVAEGIDHLSILETLREMGGDLAQGFCIARPQTLPLLEETLRLQRTTGIERVNKG